MAWAGYSKQIVSDSEILQDMGITGTVIPKWVKSEFGKWLFNNQITIEDFENAIYFLDSNKILE
jgi:hypothetical protein